MPIDAPPLVDRQPSTPPSRLIRLLLPIGLLAIWFAGAALGGPYFGRIDEVSSNDPTAYLPSNAEATQVQRQLGKFLGSDSLPAVIVAVGDQRISDEDLNILERSVAEISQLSGVAGQTSPAIPSDDGLATQIFVPISTDSDIDEVVLEIRDILSNSGSELALYVTGPAGFGADLSVAFGGIDGLLLGVALIAVFVILIAVYRSPVLPLLVLANSVFALTVALLAVWHLANSGVLLLNGQTQGILFILVIGAATDYALLYVARYREALREFSLPWDATRQALKGSWEPILASGGTVIAGLLCLLLSQLESNRTLGPVAAIGIVFAMLSAFSLLPALLLLLGRKAFWPKRPAFDQDHATAPVTGIWAKLPPLLSRNARKVWLATTAVLLIACVGVFQLKADGVATSELVLGQSEARDGQVALGEHFPGGSGSPAYVVVAQADIESAIRTISAHPGVGAVSITAAESPSGVIPAEAFMEALGVADASTDRVPPTVIEGKVLIQATLADPADSSAAEQTIRELRTELRGVATIGGVTATDVDSNDASVHDRNVIIPLVLVVILVILMMLLRAIVAPVILVVTTVISFGSAIGVAAIVFNNLFDFAGADPAVPLFGFVFLVALGIDYNIFLMTRVREEALKHGAREGVTRGLRITGGVITSAGLVLAATFAALAVIPILFLAQLAFIVAFGVLLDTIVVRSLLVPALGYELGKKMWWPSRRIAD